MTSYEEVEKSIAYDKLCHIWRAARAYKRAVARHGPAVASCDAVLAETSLMDLAQLADFAGVDLEMTITKEN